MWVNFTNVFGSSVRIEVEREREMLFTVCNAAHPSFSPLRWHLLLFVGISACDPHHSVRQLKLATTVLVMQTLNETHIRHSLSNLEVISNDFPRTIGALSTLQMHSWAANIKTLIPNDPGIPGSSAGLTTSSRGLAATVVHVFPNIHISLLIVVLVIPHACRSVSVDVIGRNSSVPAARVEVVRLMLLSTFFDKPPQVNDASMGCM